MKLKEEVDRLAQPPAGFGTFLARNEDDSIDVFTGGGTRVNVSPSVDLDEPAALEVHAQRGPQRGRRVRLREGRRGRHVQGAARGRRPGAGHRERRRGRVVRLAEPLRRDTTRAGDSLLLDARAGYVYEKVPKSEVEELVLEEVRHRLLGDRRADQPDRADPRRRRAALPAPWTSSRSTSSSRRRACCSSGPAVARRSSPRPSRTRWPRRSPRPAHRPRTGAGKSYFLNIKGPELLNKYVGETERHIRLVFQRAREKASEAPRSSCSSTRWTRCSAPAAPGSPPTSRTRSCRSCSARSTASSLLENVLVIGASNREDMIDPAILRPGRLDVKIKIERPDAESARDIFSKYLRPRCRCTPTT